MPEARVIEDSHPVVIRSSMRKWIAGEASHWALSSDQVSVAATLGTSDLPLIGVGYISMVFELIIELQRMEPGEELDHPWGFVKREEDGFRLAQPHQGEAAGNWCGTAEDFVRVAIQLFDQHTILAGIYTH